jgi:ankyrin repeat protein
METLPYTLPSPKAISTVLPSKHLSRVTTNYSLIESGADINSKNDTGYTPLHLAVTYKQLDCIKILLAHGCHLETKNSQTKTPYDDAVSLNYKDIQSILKKAMVIISK